MPAPASRRRDPFLLALALVLALVAADLGVIDGRVAPAQAQTGPTAPPATPPTSPSTELPYLGDPRVDAELGGVRVEGPEFNTAIDRYRTTERNLQTAKTTFETATAQLRDLQLAEGRLVGTLNQASRRKEKSDVKLEQLRLSIQRLAVDDYMRGDSAMPMEMDFDVGAVTEVRRQRVMIKTVRGSQLAEARANAVVVQEMTALVVATQAELDDVRARITATSRTRDQAVADQQRYSTALVSDAQAVADARLMAGVMGLDFSFVVLDAYVRAAKRMAQEQPRCAIRWTLIAAIGRTESAHGTFGGTRVDKDGTVMKPILGVLLDGTNGTALIPDSDGGALDGDARGDRAVGPMQFIPTTWTRWARDANGDGKADPQNIYDSAYAAAAYLCYFGPGLDGDAGIRGAVIHYNVDEEYVEIVLRRSKGYDEFRLPPPPRQTS